MGNCFEGITSAPAPAYAPSYPVGGIVGGPQVPPEIALEFLEALRAEFLRGQGGAVGGFFERCPPQYGSLLEPYEDMVRDNPQVEIAKLEQQWGVRMDGPPIGAPPVPPEITQDFLLALEAEYLQGMDGSVGGFFERCPPQYVSTLESYESIVRGNPQMQISSIAQQWGLPPRDGYGGYIVPSGPVDGCYYEGRPVPGYYEGCPEPPPRDEGWSTGAVVGAGVAGLAVGGLIGYEMAGGGDAADGGSEEGGDW